MSVIYVCVCVYACVCECVCVCVSVWELVHFLGPYFHDASMPNLYPKFPNPKSTPNHTPNSIIFPINH